MRGYQYDISYQYDTPRRFDIVRFRITHIRNNETFCETFCNIQAMISRTISRRSFVRPSRIRPFLLGWAENTLLLGLCDAASCRPAMRAGRHPG
jgi:hypothetical protein